MHLRNRRSFQVYTALILQHTLSFVTICVPPISPTNPDVPDIWEENSKNETKLSVNLKVIIFSFFAYISCQISLTNNFPSFNIQNKNGTKKLHLLNQISKKRGESNYDVASCKYLKERMCAPSMGIATLFSKAGGCPQTFNI